MRLWHSTGLIMAISGWKRVESSPRTLDGVMEAASRWASDTSGRETQSQVNLPVAEAIWNWASSLLF